MDRPRTPCQHCWCQTGYVGGVLHHVTGIRYVYDRDEERRSEAIVAALREFRAGHPEATVYGETHGVERVTEPAKEGS